MSDTIIVNASASLAGGVGATFDVLVDGTKIGSATAGTAEKGYSFDATLTRGEAHSVKIVYTNDDVINGQDRNLFLQSINVDGQTVAATSGTESYYSAVTGNGISNYAGDGNMYWAGTATFDLPANLLRSGGSSGSSGSSGGSPSGPGFYVSVNGSDYSGNGSAGSPFATLARAQRAMESSSIRTTYVEGGTYYPSSPLQLGSRDNGMSFVAASGQQPVLEGSSRGNLVTLDGASNVTLQGLTFRNVGGDQGAVYLLNASNNHINGNLFQNNAKAVNLSGSGGNVISGNEIDNSGVAGVLAGGGSSYNRIDSNLIDGTSLVGTGTGSAGIMMTGGNNNTILHNQVENTAGTGISLLNWDSSSQNLGDVITGNSVTNAGSSGSASDSGGIYIDGRSGGDTGTQIDNNYVSLASSPSSGNAVDIYLDDLASGVAVKNNILKEGNFAFQLHGGHDDTIVNNIIDMNAISAPNIGAALIQSEGGGSMTGNSVSQNIIYSSAGSAPTVWVTYGGTASINDNLYYNTNNLSMKGTYGDYSSDSNSKYGDPNFANPSGGNFSLGSGSAASSIGFSAINQGTIGLAPSTSHWY